VVTGKKGIRRQLAGTASAIVRSARPAQWVKNLVVFAAPVASGTVLRGGGFVPLAMTVLAFCAAAGGTYLVNDLADLNADRLHPRKRHRPIAAGEVSAGAAGVAAAGFLVTGVMFGLVVGPVVAAVVVGYEVVTFAYSRWLKHVAVVDVAALALGFVLRVAAGAAATGAGLRASLVGAVFFGTMFVALTKRRGERGELGDDAVEHRRVLAVYSDRFLTALSTGSLGGAMLSYGVWVVVRPAGEGGLWLDLSLLPLLVGVWRFATLAWQGQAADPQRMFGRERALQLAALATVILAATGAHAALT